MRSLRFYQGWAIFLKVLIRFFIILFLAVSFLLYISECKLPGFWWYIWGGLVILARIFFVMWTKLDKKVKTIRRNSQPYKKVLSVVPKQNQITSTSQ